MALFDDLNIFFVSCSYMEKVLHIRFFLLLFVCGVLVADGKSEGLPIPIPNFSPKVSLQGFFCHRVMHFFPAPLISM